MNKKPAFILGIVSFLFAACASTETDSAASLEPVKHGSTMQVQTVDSTSKFTAEMVSNKRDYICGMPVTAGIADTAHYKGKVYGFCATECKEEFLKSPEAYTAKK